MPRDILTERDWFLLTLLLLGCVALGSDLVLGAHYLNIGFNLGAVLTGLVLVSGLALLPLFARYNRWGFLVLLAESVVRLVFGIGQAIDGAPASWLYHFAGYVNGVLGLIFVVGLLARWGSFMPANRAER